VRLTRHARNRLRWIARSHPEATAEDVAEALSTAETIGYDAHRNRKARGVVGGTSMTVVVDERADVVVTIWVD
jgi:hypothetical protein